MFGEAARRHAPSLASKDMAVMEVKFGESKHPEKKDEVKNRFNAIQDGWSVVVAPKDDQWTRPERGVTKTWAIVCKE